MLLRKSARVISFTSLTLALGLIASAQTQYPPFPAGMRLVVGGSGALPRNTPSISGTCGKDNHACTAADAIVPGVYGVVQNDPPVFEPAGWWWVNVTYENGITGWTSGYPPYLNALTPPQMAQGFNFRVVGDYNGPNLTSARCINDGVQSDATMNLQAITGGLGQTGTLSCLWNAPANGNHIAVIQAINNVATVPSTEFQFSVTAQVVPQAPNAPSNLRIGPQSGTVTATKFPPPPESLKVVPQKPGTPTIQQKKEK
jgi:hypothetical protein